MSGPPVVVTEGLGRPVTNVASLNGATPMVVVEGLGEPVTLVDALGEPVTLLNADGTLWVSQTFDSLIASLLSAGEDVAFYDPNDLTSVYAARTGGANAVADGPVGLMLDKAQMGGLTAAAFIAAQPELVTNGTFDTDVSGWQSIGAATIGYSPLESAAEIDVTGAGGGIQDDQVIATVSGRLAIVEIEVKLGTFVGSLNFNIDSGNIVIAPNNSTFTRYTFLRYSTDADLSFSLTRATAATGTFFVRLVSVQELPGYHATAPSDAARPILRDVSSTYALDFDGVDDAMSWTTPAIANGTWVALTRNGSYAASAAYSAGTYTMPVFQPFDLCAILWTSADLTTVQEAIVLAEGSARGAAADFGGVSNFSFGWRNRSDLRDFPVIDTSSGTSFVDTWRSCTGLTSFPLLDVSSGQSFLRAWQQCSSLTSFPLLDVSSGTTFQDAWRLCSSLTTFPANMFDAVTATNFSNAFLTTKLTQTSIDNILTSINTAGRSGGTFNQSGGSAPSATGEAAIDALRARGWTVTVTGGY
jgi:hypothetical protein